MADKPNREENNMRMPSIRDFNTAVARVEEVVHSGPNPPIVLHGKRLLTKEQLDRLEDIVTSLFEPMFDSLEEGAVVELDGRETMLSRAGLSAFARGTTVSIGPNMFVKTDVAYWARGFEGKPLGTAKTDHVFYMMANADTRPVVTTPR